METIIFGCYVSFREGISIPSLWNVFQEHFTHQTSDQKLTKQKTGEQRTINQQFKETFTVHPRSLTWNLKIQPLEKEIPALETIIVRFHVKLWGCTGSRKNTEKKFDACCNSSLKCSGNKGCRYTFDRPKGLDSTYILHMKHDGFFSGACFREVVHPLQQWLSIKNTSNFVDIYVIYGKRTCEFESTGHSRPSNDRLLRLKKNNSVEPSVMETTQGLFSHPSCCNYSWREHQPTSTREWFRSLTVVALVVRVFFRPRFHTPVISPFFCRLTLFSQNSEQSSWFTLILPAPAYLTTQMLLNT